MDTKFMLAVACTLLSAVVFVSSENCPKGWYFYNQRKRCFLLDSEPLPWEQSRDKCKGHGGDLTVIPDNETNAFIKGLIEPSCAEYWIGLHDRSSEGVFQWLDQAGETNFSYWAPNEPNNFGDEDCVVITAAKESQWNDAKCTAYLGFSCEIEAENRSFCTGPKHENLGCHTKEPEKLTSTTLEPEMTLSQTTETDSSIPVGDCPLGWIHYHPRGRCFLNACGFVNWTEGREICKTHGADLPVIPDLATQKFIADKLSMSVFTYYWNGLRRSKHSSNQFRWLDEKTSATFTYWASRQPHPLIDCVQLYLTPNVERKWYTYDCANRLGILCEREAESRNFLKKHKPYDTLRGNVAQISPTLKPKTNTRKCPPGWLYYNRRERCFLFYCFKGTWNQSREHCKGMGADLAVIPDAQTNIFINGELGKIYATTHYWIGLRFKQEEKYCHWLDEETRAVWIGKIRNVPKHNDNRSFCVSVYMWVWYIKVCAELLPAICERPTEPSF